MNWLFDTFVWTGALIGVVLLSRRAVARHFGAKAAYALWLLPLIRLVMPPVVLPAWLAPATEPVAMPLATESVAALTLASTPVAVTTVSTMPFDWRGLVVAVWAIGAAAYIVMRLVSYFRLRRDLLTGARTVGSEGRIRLLETPATASPLAFGVFDKVVALPQGFMASSDRRARDLALSHELAHHRAHDLAFNFCALPLFALHWFNPLSLFGWRAMRRDQEAACDARVVEHRDRVERAAYAQLIASAVAGPRGALAAPMACPVLGDKSIVHRLRNLAMTNPSDRRRRMGALMIGASMLLIPLTASISYAQDEASEAPLPPAPPASPLPPEAPMAPVAPEAPRPPESGNRTYVIDDAAPHGTHRERRVIVVRDRDGRHDAHAPQVIRERRVIRSGPDGHFDEKAFEKEMDALDERLDRLGDDQGRLAMVDREAIRTATREAVRIAKVAPLAVAMAPRVVMACDGDGDGDVTETTGSDGKRVIRICRQRISEHASAGLRSARAQIARDPNIPEHARRDVLKSLDREIERMEDSE